MSWIGVLLIEDKPTVDGRVFLPASILAPVPTDPPVRIFHEDWCLTANEWCRRGNLLVARGAGDLRGRWEVGADVELRRTTQTNGMRWQMIVDSWVLTIHTARLIGALAIPARASAWPGQTFVTPELPSICTEHPERRLVCAACYPLPA